MVTQSSNWLHSGWVLFFVFPHHAKNMTVLRPFALSFRSLSKLLNMCQKALLGWGDGSVDKVP